MDWDTIVLLSFGIWWLLGYVFCLLSVAKMSKRVGARFDARDMIVGIFVALVGPVAILGYISLFKNAPKKEVSNDKM